MYISVLRYYKYAKKYLKVIMHALSILLQCFLAHFLSVKFEKSLAAGGIHSQDWIKRSVEDENYLDTVLATLFTFIM